MKERKLKFCKSFLKQKLLEDSELYILISLGMYGGERNKSLLTKVIKPIYNEVEIQHNISLEKIFPEAYFKKKLNVRSTQKTVFSVL